MTSERSLAGCAISGAGVEGSEEFEKSEDLEHLGSEPFAAGDAGKQRVR